MRKSYLRTYGFLGAMLAAIVLGCLFGALWPGAVCLEPLGTIFINLMFCIVVPLVFCSLAGSVANMHSPKRAGTDRRRTDAAGRAHLSSGFDCVDGCCRRHSG